MGLKKRFKSNLEQWAVYETVGNYKTIVVEDLAGTGKTTTLIACGEKLANQNKRFLNLAFNSEIVKDTKRKDLSRKSI